MTKSIPLVLSLMYIVDCSVSQGSVLGALKFITHTEDVPVVIEKRNIAHHLYADNGQLSDHPSIATVPASINNLEICVHEVHNRCTSKCLQLNPNKAEVIWFGTADRLRKSKTIDLDLHVKSDSISPVSVVRDLRVLINSELAMKQHVNKTVSICYYQIRRLNQVRRILGPDIAARLVSAYIISILDYCNFVLAGLTQKTIAPLQRVQNAAARLISSLGPRDHITSTLRDLHWPQVKYRVQYQLCLMMHTVYIERSPRYISELVTATASLLSR